MGLAARGIWISQRISHGNMVESEKLRGRETVLGFHAERYVMRMLTNYQVRHWSRTTDGEPYALKGARTVRGGGHAIPARVNGPYSTEGC